MKIGKYRRAFSLMQLLHLGAWLAVFLLSWGVFLRMMSIEDSFWRACLNSGLLALLFYGTGWLYQQYYETRRFAALGLWLTVVMLFISVLRFLINR